ncbi:MAG TPA: hypothetical protein VIQ31_20415 [Phormidium sp.]
MGLGLWQGEYQGINRLWLRWYNEQGKLILTDAERENQRAEAAERRAAEAQQRAEEAERRAEILAQRLRELGIKP